MRAKTVKIIKFVAFLPWKNSIETLTLVGALKRNFTKEWHLSLKEKLLIEGFGIYSLFGFRYKEHTVFTDRLLWTSNILLIEVFTVQVHTVGIEKNDCPWREKSKPTALFVTLRL